MEGFEKVAITAGQVSIPIGLLGAIGWGLIKAWYSRSVQLEQAKERNIKLESQLQEIKAQHHETIVQQLRSAVHSVTQTARGLVAEMSGLKERIAKVEASNEHLTRILERVLKARTEATTLSKNATLYRTKKASGSEDDGDG